LQWIFQDKHFAVESRISVHPEINDELVIIDIMLPSVMPFAHPL